MGVLPPHRLKLETCNKIESLSRQLAERIQVIGHLNLQLAVQNDDQIKVSDIEFKLPKPSYTIDTLTYLQEKFPQHQFYVIMGGDSFQNLPKWKNFETLVKNYQFIVYRRPGFDITDDYGAKMQYLEAPMLELSATLIRNNCKDGITIKYLVPEDVRLEIERCNYFKEEVVKTTDGKDN
jgi:nicotinate-nucleotide adenylyltransferase